VRDDMRCKYGLPPGPRRPIDINRDDMIDALAESIRAASQCKHHWHEDPNPTRTHRPDWSQAKCCRCLVSAWIRQKRKKSCSSLKTKPLGKASDVELRGQR